jgi:23S rRNA pseudouridine1911/1915/1917 synthase
MTEHLIAERPERLMTLLRRRLPGWKRTTLEQRLLAGCVRVNGETVTRNGLLAAGDEVVLAGPDEAPSPRPGGGLRILYEDDALIAVDKPAGLLSVSTDRQSERTALALLRDSLSLPGRPARLWPVHRIDRETSGVLLFARSRAAQQRVQEHWTEARKRYLAVVEGRPMPPDGVVEQPLFEDARLNVRVGEHPEARLARTRYFTRRAIGRRTLLEVELDTGRRHQIRAHLAWLGHPVVGDARYGTKGPRLGLHALSLSVPHPDDGRALLLEAPPPAAFKALLRSTRSPERGRVR